MKKTRMRLLIPLAFTGVATLTTAIWAQSNAEAQSPSNQSTQSNQPMHPGYAYGPGIMGYGPAYGMGPGMMWGYGPGGGYGAMGPGMMGAVPPAYLNLSDEQRQKITKIQQDRQRKDWELQGKLRGERAELYNLYTQESPDPRKVGEQYDRVASLRKQLWQNRAEAQHKINDVLNKEQRAQLQQWRRSYGQAMGGGMGYGGYGYGPVE
jgi:Spy/CpxP family protein refolding chaperone